MGNLLDAIQRPDIVQSIDTRRQTAMQTEDLVVDERGERKIVEKVGEVLPNVCVTVLAQALVVKPIHLRDLTRLVVSAEDGNPLGISDLQSHEQSDSLDRVITSINVISCKAAKKMSDYQRSRHWAVWGSSYGCHTHEEIIGVGVWAADFEQLHQVVELAVNVTANRDGAFLES